MCGTIIVLPASSGAISEGQAKDRISALEQETQRIKNTLSHIDDLSLKQVQTELQNALRFVEQLQDEATQQEHLVQSLIETAEQHKKEAEQAKAMADSVAAMTAPHIILTLPLTRNIKRNAARAQVRRTIWSTCKLLHRQSNSG